MKHIIILLLIMPFFAWGQTKKNEKVLPDSLYILTNLYHMDIDSTIVTYDTTELGDVFQNPYSIRSPRKMLKLQYNLRKLDSLLETELKYALSQDSINNRQPKNVIRKDSLYIKK